MKRNENSVVLIAGPTASGKSALALTIAKSENGVIINTDSMQVYRELRVLTSRPSLSDEMAMPHRLYGHVSASAAYSVATWQKQAMAEIEHHLNAGKTPILVGGTGLYFMSLTNGLAAIPEAPLEVRTKWRGFTGNLHAELQRLDPQSAARLNPSDRQRLVRALEVRESTGRPIGDWYAEQTVAAPLGHCKVRKLFRTMPREVLYARAEARFDQMLAQGALEEVASLPALEPTALLLKAIGVRELLAVLHNKMPLDEATIKAKTATRNYIKRQITWWRGRMQDWEVDQAEL